MVSSVLVWSNTLKLFIEGQTEASVVESTCICYRGPGLVSISLYGDKSLFGTPVSGVCTTFWLQWAPQAGGVQTHAGKISIYIK